MTSATPEPVVLQPEISPELLAKIAAMTDAELCRFLDRDIRIANKEGPGLPDLVVAGRRLPRHEMLTAQLVPFRKLIEQHHGPDVHAVIARSRAVSAELAKAWQTFRTEAPELYHEEPMDATTKVQKCFEHGGSFSLSDARAGVEAVAELIYRREPALTRDEALSKAFQTPVFPFREAGEANPLWADVYRQAEQAGTPEQAAAVAKAADDEAAAWARLEAVADRLQRVDPKLSRPAAVSKALIDAEGIKAYRDYQRAQRSRELALHREAP